jgi:DNA replication protein DnaC
MDMTHHLTTNLKRLRMPGMIDNLESRCREAADLAMGYREFLSLLVQDEIASRESNNLVKRIKWGGLSGRLTFEGFDYRFNAESIPPETVRDLASCHFIERNQNLILCGPPGIGKTHIAQAIGHEVCRRGHEVAFFKTHKLLEGLLDAAYPRRADRVRKKCVNARLLILDDFGFRRYDAKESEMLYAISDERLGKGSTILTSNRPCEDWYGVFPDPVVGGAVLDRFVSSAVKVIIEKAKSYRKDGSHAGKGIQRVLE